MKRGIFLFIIFLFVESCKDPFYPPVSANEVNYLSVDGKINATDGTASVKLTRAVQLSSSDQFPAIEDATVMVEDNEGNAYSIPHAGRGVYESGSINFDLTKKYKLKITLKDGKKYSSAPVPLVEAGSIDSLWWQPTNDGVAIKLNASAQEHASRFYFWKFTETWEHQSYFYSFLKIDASNNVTQRFPDEQIYQCWSTFPSTSILIKSTDGLTKNSVNQFQVNLLPLGTVKLLHGYSILVEQHLVPREFYEYKKLLQQTTQNVGGLFDPLPSEVIGNISNDSDPDEPVLGYFYGGTVSTKRIFISYSDLPLYLKRVPPAIDCQLTSILIRDLPARDKSLIIIGPFGEPTTQGYTFSTAQCADCTYSGGTTVRPSFWP